MELEKLNEILRKQAIKHGLCDDWQKNVWNRVLSYEELIEIYIRGFDFSVNNDWLNYDFIQKVFPEDELHKGHVYINEEVDLSVEQSGFYVFLGDCTGKVDINGLYAVTLYLRHDSEMTVNVASGACAFVRCFDKADATLVIDKYSKGIKYEKRNKKNK